MTDIFSSLPILILLPFLATAFILMSKKEQLSNIYNVCFLAIIANMIIVIRFFYLMDISSPELQLVTKTKWLDHLNISFVFGAEMFSLFLILALHLGFLIILSGLKDNPNHPKTLTTFSMLFLSMTTGLLISNDLFSFYLFFEAVLIPLFLLIGIGGGIKKQEKISSFFLYNMFFSLLFFIGIITLFNYPDKSYILEDIHSLELDSPRSYFIWIAIFLSLLSRLPIWPFHRMLSSMNSDIKNPLVFFASNILPLTAIYGFIKLMPQNPDGNMQIIITSLTVVAIISMACISLIAYAHKDFQYKIFSFINVIYIFFLIAVFIKGEGVGINISLSFFAFVLAISGIEILLKRYNDNNHELDYYNKNILRFLVFCLLGAPFSSIFLNNFAIFSYLYQDSVIIASIAFLSVAISGAGLIEESFKIKTTKTTTGVPYFLAFICFLLLMSFVKPFWFVEL